MNKVLSMLAERAIKDFPMTVAIKKLSDWGIQKSTFSITVDQRQNGYLYNKLLAELTSNIVFELGNNRRINPFPKKREDVSVLGLGVVIVKLNGIYMRAILGERKDVLSGINCQVIYLQGYIRNMSKTEEYLKDLGFPKDMFLPYVTDAADDILGLVEERYGTQRQFIQPDIYAELDAAFDRMVNDKEWYIQNELPHKETFLLYGPPGTGKSTLARHFASKYWLNIKSITPAKLRNDYGDMLSDKPTILLLEDIDAYEFLLKPEFRTAVVTNTANNDEAIYSYFINILDGVVPLKNVIVIMTTNFREKLIESIYREGRVDRSIYMGRYTPAQIIDFAGWASKDPRSNYIRKQNTDIINVAVLKKITMAETVDDIKAIMKPVIESAKAKETEVTE